MTEPLALNVACVMLSRRQGGLEQSMIDDCEALALAGHHVLAVIEPDWPGRAALKALSVALAAVSSWNEWDPLAWRRIRAVLRAARPAVVLTVGRRASILTRRALKPLPELPQVARTPNYSFKGLPGLAHVIASTEHLAQALIAAGHPPERISVIPNLVRVPSGAAPRRPATVGPPVIGALGRFVAKKGFGDLIDALALLRQRGRDFTALLAGAGPEEASLRARAAAAGLGAQLTLPGWITDKRAFFAALDVVAVPSREEPFGIVVLEAMAHGVPTVAGDATGPRAIITHRVDGLLVPRGDPRRLADALEALLEDPELRARLATSALETVRTRYALPTVAAQISATLRTVVRRHAADLRQLGR